jgi:hypothetical protein
MLNTYLEIIQAVQSDLNVTDEAPLYPLATIKNAIGRSYMKCAGLFKWPGTEGAKYTTSQANIEYYDYPQEFKDDSIWRIEVDGVQYGQDPDGSPMAYEDYLQWRADTDNNGSTDKKWANQRRRVFIYPVPTTATAVISVWGYQTPDELSADGDVTIWSYSMPECNEAIAMEAEAILKAQGEEDTASDFRSNTAKQILVVAWSKIRQEQSKYQKVQPYFSVFDMFGTGTTKQNTGNFD